MKCVGKRTSPLKLCCFLHLLTCFQIVVHAGTSSASLSTNDDPQTPNPTVTTTSSPLALPTLPETIRPNNVFTDAAKKNWTLQQKIGVVEEIVCLGRCGSSFPGQSPKSMPLSCQRCHCDETCLTYHTCCPDVVLDGRANYQGVGGECVELVVTGVDTSDLTELNNRTNLLSSMVTTCPALHEESDSDKNWSVGAGTRSKCESPDLGRLEDHLPVTDTTTEVTYRNVHCATCHNVGLDVLHTWGLEIGCGGGNADLLFQSNPGRRELYRMLTSKEEVKRTGCYLLYVPRGKMFHRECRYAQHPVIETCNETGLWTPELYDREIERACLRYTSLFKNRYKNVFCYLCNVDRINDILTLLKLFPYIDTLDVAFARVTFSVLVDFSDADGGSQTEARQNLARQCGETQFFDNLTCSCRDIKCSEGKELITEDDMRTCRSFVVSKTIGYQACVKVDILFPNDVTEEDFERLELFHTSNPINVSFNWTSVISRWCPGDRDLTFHFSIRHVNIFSFDSLETMEEKFESMEANYCQALKNQSAELGHVGHCKMDLVNTCPEPTSFITPCTSNDTIKFNTTEIAVQQICCSITFIKYRKTNRCAFVEISIDDFEETESTLRLIASNRTVDKSKADFISRTSTIRLCLEDYMQLTQVNTSNCGRRDEQDASLEKWTTAGLISVICSCISLLFLFLILLTYSIFENLRSCSGKNIIVLTVTLFIAIALYEFTIEQVKNKALCSAFGVLIHYFWLASAFSMNACTVERFYKLCFPLQSRSFFLSDKPFLMATVWTFVCPLLVVCCNAGINFAVKQDIGYGNPFLCYINERYSRILSFVVPMCAIVVCNLSLLVFTVVKVRKHSSLAGDLKVVQTRIGLAACVRLSVVTGVTWLVSFLYEALPYPVMGYIFTALIGLQGVIFFFSIVVNRRVIDLYKALLSSKITIKGSSSDDPRL